MEPQPTALAEAILPEKIPAEPRAEPSGSTRTPTLTKWLCRKIGSSGSELVTVMAVSPLTSAKTMTMMQLKQLRAELRFHVERSVVRLRLQRGFMALAHRATSELLT